MVMRPDRFRAVVVEHSSLCPWRDQHLERPSAGPSDTMPWHDGAGAEARFEPATRTIPASCTGLRPTGHGGTPSTGSTCFDRPRRRAALGRSGVCPTQYRAFEKTGFHGGLITIGRPTRRSISCRPSKRALVTQPSLYIWGAADGLSIFPPYAT